MRIKSNLLIVLVLLFLLSLPISAKSNVYIEEKIESHLSQLTKDYNWKITEVTSLIDSSGAERYSHFSTSNGKIDGYVVYDHYMNEVVEFSIDGNNLQNKEINNTNKIYYFGPTLLYVEKEEMFENVVNPNDFHDKKTFISLLSKKKIELLVYQIGIYDK